MKKLLNLPVCLAMGVFMSVGLSACSDNETPADNTTDESEEQLMKAIVPYVDNTIIQTYKVMADEAIRLSDCCTKAKDAYINGDKAKATAYVADACKHWTASRAAWELSEAFLFGAAGDYNIDPHIDSWPLDKVALDKLLNNEDIMNQIGESGGAYVSNNLGYGLLGFHSLEYILFQLTSDTSSEPRDFSKNYAYPGQVVNITNNHMVYMAAVAEDLRNQCVRLEASWAGIDNVSDEKKTILADNELEPSFEYGMSMKTAGKAGSKYKSFNEAAQEVLIGCTDIVDEVGAQKIGRPNAGTNEDDKNYIESPYALNSIVDFADNIISVKNSYEGFGFDGKENTMSISRYVASIDPAVDQEVKALIEQSIADIKAIPEPFSLNAQSDAADKAMDTLTRLSAALEKASDVLLK